MCPRPDSNWQLRFRRPTCYPLYHEGISGIIIPDMDDINQHIKDIEKEIRETPYHKGTEHYIGLLRARLARLKDRQIEGFVKSKGGGGGAGYAVKKTGDATVVLIGPPSCGKSTLINALTNAESKVAAYAFTTLSVIPGMLKYNDAYIQIFDVPGLISGAKEGKGRGREVLSVARGADLLLIMTDIDRPEAFTGMLAELKTVGIRINEVPPEVKVDKKLSGGLVIHSNIKQDIPIETIKEVAQEFGLKNAEITVREKLTIDRLIDSFSTSRVYVPAIFVVSKVDKSDDSNDSNRRSDRLYISAQKEIGLEELKRKIWEKLNLLRVYLVHPDEEPSTNNPIIMKKDQTLQDVALKIGSDFAEEKKSAKIWGPKAHFPGQEVPLTTQIAEEMQIRFI